MGCAIHRLLFSLIRHPFSPSLLLYPFSPSTPLTPSTPLPLNPSQSIGQFEIVGKGWDSSLGGFAFDVRLAEMLGAYVTLPQIPPSG